MVKILHDNDADMSLLDGKTIAVIGYGNQGSAQALCLRDSGVQVIIGETEMLNEKPNPSWQRAKDDGFKVMSISKAAKTADIIHILLPDEFQGSVYRKNIRKHMKAGKTLCCSHGFNIVFKAIVPPADVDVIMVAPKSPGSEERKAYLAGFGVPGLIAIRQNPSGKAKNIALAMAKAMRFTKAGCLECTFEQETYEDLFGEQTVLCGGLVELMKAGFEVLVEAGYPAEMAYFECVHEMKLIVDLIYEGGIQKMNATISNTAEWGEYEVGPKIITPKAKLAMKKALKDVENGKFARKWLRESKNGAPNLKA
nr:ketol-acid reductoisomerase [Victivallales bacterium]